MSATEGRVGLVTVCTGCELPWSAVGAFLSAEGLSQEALSFTTSQPTTTGSRSSSATQYAAGLVSAAADVGGSATRDALGAAARVLAAGASIYVYDSLRVSGGRFRGGRELAAQFREAVLSSRHARAPTSQDAPRQESIAKELTLAGFTGTRVEAVQGVVLVGACCCEEPAHAWHCQWAAHATRPCMCC